MKWAYDTVTMKNHLQLKFPFALWTSKMIGQAISKRFSITLKQGIRMPSLESNAPRFLEFIKRLVQNASRPVFLIVDGHPVHRAKTIKVFAEENKDRFRLFYLPPYSPELNPDERVWNDLKNNAIGRKSIESTEQLHKNVIGFLGLLQFCPSRVRSYFTNETTRYTA
jgi:transposase